MNDDKPTIDYKPQLPVSRQYEWRFALWAALGFVVLLLMIAVWVGSIYR